MMATIGAQPAVLLFPALLLGLGVPIVQPATKIDVPGTAAVQGDRAFARDLASEFLTGCSFSYPTPEAPGPRDCTKFLHVPRNWRSIQLQLDPYVSDYSSYFQHGSVIDSQGRHGQEASPQIGIEDQRVLFYAGHGSPEWLSAIWSQTVGLDAFSVGDGNARYFLALSCNLFAHGPQDPTSPTRDFDHPESFKAADFVAGVPWTDLKYEANVFHAWGQNYAWSGFRSPLNPRLRLACGGSSEIGDSDNVMQGFWHYFSLLHLPPADSFLLGLYDPVNHVVPLCISRGDNYLASGLVDSQFMDQPLATSLANLGKSIFISYPVREQEIPPSLAALAVQSAPAAPAPRFATPDDVPNLPVLAVGPAPAPSLLDITKFKHPPGRYGFVEGTAQELQLSLDLEKLPKTTFDNNDLCVARQPDIGAVIFNWRPIAHQGGPNFSSLVESAGAALLTRLIAGLPRPAPQDPGIGTGEPINLQMNVDQAPAAQNNSATDLTTQTIKRQGGCLYVRRPEVYHQGNLKVEIAGESTETLARLCPTSALAADSFSPGTNDSQDACARAAAPLVSLAYSARAYAGPASDRVTYVALGDALAEATRLLQNREPGGAYQPQADVHLVYRAAPVHCQQDKMYLFYRIRFTPTPPSRVQGFPPVTIDVPAQLPQGRRIADTWEWIQEGWTCAPERPAPGNG